MLALLLGGIPGPPLEVNPLIHAREAWAGERLRRLVEVSQETAGGQPHRPRLLRGRALREGHMRYSRLLLVSGALGRDASKLYGWVQNRAK